MLNRENVKNIRDLVYEAAKNHGNKDYLRYLKNGEINGITFQEFKDAADAISAWTMEQNKKLGRAVKVAMLSPNNPVYTKVLLGVMCGGGISIPMDPKITHETLCNCINRAQADIIIYDKTIQLNKDDILEKCKTIKDIFYMQDEGNEDCLKILEQYKGSACDLEINEKECAVVIFTSGTTGVEKGVMLSHANLIDNIFTREFEPKVKLSILPVHHIFGLKADFLLPLNISSTTCFFDGMEKLGEAIQIYQPSSLNMVPMIANGLYSKLVILSQKTGKTLKECKELVYGKNLEQLVTGGAHLPAELVEKYQEIGIYITQGYGISESSPTIAEAVMDRPDKAHAAGKLVKNCEYRIVDGELQVKSPSVMMGYINAPELTREILTEDGWLCTGDLGYVDEERFLYITGRKKNLIILSNGENVAPEQIENLLLDHQLIEECLVYGEGNQVVAELYPNEKYCNLHHITDIPGEIEKIIYDVNSKVTSYKKIMKHMIRKVPFLKTGTNKIIRNQKAKAEDILVAESDKVTMPTNEIQKMMHQIFSEIIGNKNFGIDTDLFSAGMDSLGCIMTLTALSDKLNFHIELDEFMSNSTIQKLEMLYEKKTNENKVDYSVRPIYPLINIQKYMAYVLRNNTTSNVPFLYKMDPDIDVDKLKKAVEQLFEIHPILKGSISMYEDKGLAMYRDDKKEINIPIYELTKQEWSETKAQLVRPFAYGKDDPLYRIGIYKVEEERYLFVDVAHAISDGMTLSIMLRNIGRLYQGEEVKKENYTYYEYMVDDEYRQESGLRRNTELYYQKLLKELKVERSILNKVRNGELDKKENAAIHDMFKSVNLEELEQFCHKNGISKNIIFLTAFNYCISIFSDKEDTISASIHNGRTDSRWGNIAGAIFMTYHFRCRLDNNESIKELLEKSAKQVMETMCCQVHALRADEMFIQYQGDLFKDIKLGGKIAEHVPIQLDSLPFHLMVYEMSHGYTYELRYWPNRYQENQLRVFMDVMEAVVNGIIRLDKVSELRSCISKNYFVEDKKVVIADKKNAMVTIKNRHNEVQPIEGWGTLFINGVNTGRIARLTIDGVLDYLEDSGRTIAREAVTGRYYVDLNKVEQDVKELIPEDGKVTAYIQYGDKNLFVLVAHIETKEELENKEEIKKVVEAHCKKDSQSFECIFSTLCTE